nr:PREDICTED: uncharacterized protein LOC102349702 [Latimeria chalumnae]|eukprot:XP_005990587.1 PREDICTED: uncharacterized protein LOC102349702 [Latimeria chalumnae]
MCQVKHKFFDQVYTEKANFQIIESIVETSHQVIIGCIIGIITALLAVLGFLIYIRYFKKGQPIISEINCPSCIVHKELCDLKIDVSGFKPESIQISWHASRPGNLENIHKWTHKSNFSSRLYLNISHEERLIQNVCEEQKEWNVETTELIQNDDGTFSVSSSLKFLPDIERDDKAEILCEVIHEASNQPVTRSVLLKVNGVSPKLTYIITPPVMLHNEIAMLTCPINFFKPHAINISWHKYERKAENLVKRLLMKKDIAQSDDCFIETVQGGYSHSISKLNFPDFTCSMNSTLYFKPTIKDDDGTEYSCEVMHMPLQNLKEVKTKLQVTVFFSAHPVVDRIISIPSNPEAGKELTLTCKVHSFHPPQIVVKWLMDGTQVPSTENTSSIAENVLEDNMIEKCGIMSQCTLTPTVKDIGKIIVFQVEHKNFVSPIVSEYHLKKLVSSPEVDIIHCNPTNPEFGKECTLSCDIRKYFPKEIQVEWYKDDIRIEKKTIKEDNTIVDGLCYKKTEIKFTPTIDDHHVEFRLEVCHSTTSTKPATRRFKLQFQAATPKVSEITCNIKQPVKGQEVILSCTASDFCPEDIVFLWSKGWAELKDATIKKYSMCWHKWTLLYAF